MDIIISPLIGFIFGLFLIIFRKKVANYIQKSYENFPHYKDGIETFNIKFNVRPAYIIAIGITICLFSSIGLFGAFVEVFN